MIEFRLQSRGHSAGDLAFACAVQQESLLPGPLGDGLAEEGFAGVSYRSGGGIERLEGVFVAPNGGIQSEAVINVKWSAIRSRQGGEILSADVDRIILDPRAIWKEGETVHGLDQYPDARIRPRGGSMPTQLLAKEQVPPNLPVGRRCWNGCGRLGLRRSCAGLADGNDQLITRLDVVALGAGPILDCLIGAGVCHLGLQGHLGLNCLSGLGADNLFVLSQQVQLLQTGIEVNHHQHEHQDACEHNHPARVDGPTIHTSILPAVVEVGKNGTVWYNFAL